jgi:hypothetical protein
MSQIGNADEMPDHFLMPSNYTVDDVQAKSLVTKTQGFDNMHVTVTLAVFFAPMITKESLYDLPIKLKFLLLHLLPESYKVEVTGL